MGHKLIFDQVFQILIFYFKYIIRNFIAINQLLSQYFFLFFNQFVYFLLILIFQHYKAINVIKFVLL